MVSGRGISSGTDIGFSWICSDPSESDVVEIEGSEGSGVIGAVSEVVAGEEKMSWCC